MSATGFVRVARVADVPRGQDARGHRRLGSIPVRHTRESWFAADNICTHAYAKLSEGRLRKNAVPLSGEDVAIALGERAAGS